MGVEIMTVAFSQANVKVAHFHKNASSRAASFLISSAE
jgi:hypothetical protein